ncbi:MAG: carbamoyltransferase HypF [Nitrospinae bacterium]|nr:carbamoyltransferase HypF [Nitrospinota bacterium]
MRERLRIHVNGIVQGVGFRPFVYRLARELGVGGFVSNHSGGVLIEAEADGQESIRIFCARLKAGIPPLAQITEFSSEEIPPIGETAFSIRPSSHDGLAHTLISPDICVCGDCLLELFDPKDRRFRYPFINCTNCGPRYTIVHGIPYDRPLTSMKKFPLCRECGKEYNDPADRRFHAQPNACPACGPSISLHLSNGDKVEAEDLVEAVVSLLREGKIVAIRGVGGFHLAVDAMNQEAVMALRGRKGRAEKPFALMAPDVESVRKFCHVDLQEEEALLHPTRPIVLLRARGKNAIAPGVAPGSLDLGFMLPCAPLHYLIIKDRFDALVMTSGNFSEEPIAIGNEEAVERLAAIADYLLLHDREILQRCDDSILRVVAGERRMIRRSRGYVPAPIFLPSPASRPILACGGDLKNTVALVRDRTVFLSQHIGDLDNPSALSFFEHGIANLGKILEITPEVIAHDLHPEYLSTKWALGRGLPTVGVQHHHAHLASVMAENGVEEKCIGIILDGTGYGTDGTIWGGEVLIGDFKSFERFAWLAPVPLPGGAAAVRQPWRMAISYLYSAFGREFLNFDLPFLRQRTREEVTVLLEMMERGLNSPDTSSCGRLFDAVSALLDIRQAISYEAQAAMDLETAVDVSFRGAYAVMTDNAFDGGPLPGISLFRAVAEDMMSGAPAGKIAAKFHQGLGEMFLRAARSARDMHGINTVGLSGGVFQNLYLFSYILKRLREEGFAALTHRLVPSNDGGLALGQAVITTSARLHNPAPQ